MDAIESQDEETLRQELRQAREGLEGLVRDLHEIDEELAAVAVEASQFRLLQDVCVKLEELGESGGAELFWGDRIGNDDGGAHLRMVRGRIDGFEKKVGEIESRRMSIVDHLDLQGENADILAGAVLEAERLEELKKLEWVVEREDVEVPFKISMMPWARGGEDDRLFRKSLAASLLIALFLGLMLPLIDLPIPDRWEVIEVPERFARLVREKRPPPPPPKAIPETKQTETDELVPAEELAETVSPELKKAAPDPKPSPDTGSKGILAFRDSFSGLAKIKTANLLGSKARISNSGKTASGMPERSLVTSQAPGSSGGINLAGLSRDVGGGSGQGMDGIQVVQATSSIGMGGGGSDRPLSGGRTAGRTDEEIQIVFDRHKSALYRLYNRELRKNPTLEGQMVLRMTIEADGSVSLCEVTSTDLKSPTLSAQVVARVRTFDFGAKEGISALTILYPIDFLPAL